MVQNVIKVKAIKIYRENREYLNLSVLSLNNLSAENCL